MNFASPVVKRLLSVLPFILLYFWFRFEQTLHSHSIYLLSSSVLFVAMLPLLYRIFSGKTRWIILVFWSAISILVFADFVLLSTYGKASDLKFLSHVDRDTKLLKQRTEELLVEARLELDQIQNELRQLGSSAPDTIAIRLQAEFGSSDFWWGVYREGRLLAWNGQPPAIEGFPADGIEEITWFPSLHRLFLKIKREMSIGEDLYYISLLFPVAENYGIETRYLHEFNRITDGLATRPRLLYGSVSTTESPEILVRNVQVTPEFAVSAMFKTEQYQMLLQSRIERLHWWLEAIVLFFLIYSSLVLTFSFVGACGAEGNGKGLLLYWLSFLLISILAALTAAQFTVFGADSILRTRRFSLDGFGGIFHSPGTLLFASFFAINLMFSLFLVFRRLRPAVPRKFPKAGAVLLIVMLFIACYLLVGYFGFIKTIVVNSAFDLTDFSVRLDRTGKLCMIFGILWLDLSFVMFLGLFLSVFIGGLGLTRRSAILVFSSQVIASLLFYFIYRRSMDIPLIPAVVLFFSVASVVFVWPVIWKRFEKLNLLSRFFTLLLICSIASFCFYFVRISYSKLYQQRYVERVAASQVMGAENQIREVLRVSQQELDAAVKTLSINPRISDTSYRLWILTELGRRGYRSAVAIYDEAGQQVNRFSLALPALNLDVTQMAQGERWTTKLNEILYSRKPVLIGIRALPGVGYLVVEALASEENLTFVPSGNPFRELFRPESTIRSYMEPDLNVYDQFWHPVYQTSSALLPSVDRARNALTQTKSAWISQTIQGVKYNIHYFRTQRGFAALIVPERTLRNHLVQLIDLFILNFFWLSGFSLTLTFFFKSYLALHFESETPIRFSFFQKMLLAFVVFSLVPLLSLTYLIRDYVWSKKTEEITSRALNTFSVASEFVNQFLFQTDSIERGPAGLDDEVAEYVGQAVQQDVSFFRHRYLVATSRRELYRAGLTGELIEGKTDVDLNLRGQRYSISQLNIGSLSLVNFSGRVYRGRIKDEIIISIPFLIEERSIEAEISGLREYMVLVGAGLILLAAAFGFVLARRFARPVRVLIHGTAEMGSGNLRHRIPEVYRDEFQQLVKSFNAMAGSLDEQQQDLEQRRAYIENILNNITTGVVSIDRTMKVTTINPSASKILGLDPLYRGGLHGLVRGGGEWDRVQDAVDRLSANPERLQSDEVSLFLTNREVNLRIVFVPLFDNHEWNGGVLLIEDISDITRSQRLSAYAEMARRVAHEVKNPLTPIQLAIEHLVKVYEDRSESFEDVLRACSDAVLKQVRSLRRLVSDFSQFGRPSTLDRVEVGLNEFLDDLVRTYQLHLPEGTKMETHLEPGLPKIRIDPEKMRGALMNIIENGLQAMNGGGEIRLEAARRPDGFLKIMIHDTGKGIPPEVLPRLFEPYFSTKSGGTGLGLPIARKSIEDHGGRIEVQSKEGQGTTVTVLLPEAR